METPKEKAQSLFAKYQNIESERYPLGMDDDDVYECAKIAVEELIKESSDRTTTIRFKGCNLTDKEYFQEVLNELNKL